MADNQPERIKDQELSNRSRRHLPPGAAWFWEGDGEFLLVGLAGARARFYNELIGLNRDMLPQETTNFLGEWLESVSLPDNCSDPETPDGIDQILFILRGTGAESVEDYETLFPGSQVIEHFISRVGEFEAGDELVNSDDWMHTWVWQFPEGSAEEVFEFIVGEAVAGDPLGIAAGNFTCRVLQITPSHQQVFIEFV